MLNPTRIQTDQSLGILTQPGEPQVVLLHGLAGHRGEWLKVVEHLPTDMGLVVPDLRGHGTSFDGNQRAMDRSAFVQDVVAILEAEAAGPVTLVGHSIGGVIATLVAAEMSHLVSNLILVETGIEALTSKELRQLKRWFKLWPKAFADTQSAMMFFGIDMPSSPAWVAGLKRTDAGLVPRFDKQSMLNAAKSLGGEERWKQWQSLAADTTLIVAKASAVAEADRERMLELRPQTVVHTVDNASHDVHLDQPASVAALIKQTVRPEAIEP